MPSLLGTSTYAWLLFWLSNLLVKVQPAPKQSIQVHALPIQWHSSAAVSSYDVLSTALIREAANEHRITLQYFIAIPKHALAPQ